MIQEELESGLTLRVDPVGRGAFRVRTSASGEFGRSTLVRYRIVRFPASEEANAASSASIDRAGAVTVTGGGAEALTVRLSDGGLEVALSPDEQLYGLGDASRDTVQRRGQRLDTWVRNVASYAPAPFVMSSAGWGVFVNSTRRMVFDLGASDPSALRVSGVDCATDFVVLSAPEMADVLSAYTAIAGRPALLPLSAYGLTYVCNQDVDARAMLDEALRMREHNIPCDVIGLEPGWMETRYDYTTDKRWHPERFYIPMWMLDQTRNRNWGDGKAHTFFGALERLRYKLSLWLCCDYDLSYEAERRALPGDSESASADADAGAEIRRAVDDVEQDKRLQKPVLMDQVTKIDEPWFEHLKQFVDQGAAAFKLDGANQVMEHPDRRWGNGMGDEEMHNLYPVLLSQQMHEGFVEHTGRRPLIYSAAGYTGAPQFAATWAGDTGGGPRPLVSMLNHGLSGHSNTSCDMDVFSRQGIHFGFLQPWSQVCSWAYWRQPWLLGEELEPVFRDYATLRYRLLPYLYSMAWRAHRTGLPILRAMALAFPDDSASHGSLTQYMLGDAFLVGAFSEEIRLPAGEWVDYWTGERQVGPADLRPAIPADRGGPLLVKAGSIVPTWPPMSHAGGSPETIGVDYFPGPASSFELYEDDGETVAYAVGAHATTEITAETVGDDIAIVIGPRIGDYAGMPRQRRCEVTVRTGRACREVSVDGQARDVASVVSPGVIRVEIEEDPQRLAPARIAITLS
jgi:alpha-glucosidase (family GH31 glycosyl hydrolase)